MKQKKADAIIRSFIILLDLLGADYVNMLLYTARITGRSSRIIVGDEVCLTSPLFKRKSEPQITRIERISQIRGA